MWLAVLAKLVPLAAGATVAAAVVPGVEADGGAGSLLWIPALFGLLNAGLGPALRRLAVPLSVVSLGLSSLVVNSVLLAGTAAVSDALAVGGLLTTVLAALVISTVTTLLDLAVGALVDETW